jgi:hypothetical protein
MPLPLRGSYESLVRQNEKTEDDGLERIEDDDDLADRIARKMLVPVPVSAALNINGNLPENRRYCRPWTASFLSDLARAHAAEFHGPLEVSSAVRTVAYQKQLMKVNGNATAAEGDVASPHLTGASIDIAKQTCSPARRSAGCAPGCCLWKRPARSTSRRSSASPASTSPFTRATRRPNRRASRRRRLRQRRPKQAGQGFNPG